MYFRINKPQISSYQRSESQTKPEINGLQDPCGQTVSLSQPGPEICLETGKNPTRAGIVWRPLNPPANPRLPRIFQLPPESVLTGVQVPFKISSKERLDRSSRPSSCDN